MKRWGKDHWSLLLYVETRCVDYHGLLDDNHMRNKRIVDGARAWNPDYGTRLASHDLGGGKTQLGDRLPGHDDYDCLEDIERAGLIKNVGTGLNPQIVMTDLGYSYITKLRKWKADGGQCSDFKP